MGVLYGFVAVVSTTLLLLLNPTPLNSGLVNSNLQCRKQPSICKPTTQCPEIFEMLPFISDPPFCDLKKVCCPLPAINIPLDSKNPWALACKEYQNILGDVKETKYIVDGKEAEPKEFPFMALLGYRNETNQTEWKCGGTLITPSWVLTATHCINQLKNDTLVVRLGELDYDTADNNTQEFDRVTVVAYSTFDDEDFRHDIALIRLGRNATLNPYVLPACMPTTNAVNYDYYLVAGWGKTSKHGAPSNQLLKTKIYQNPNCSVMFDQSLNNKICAGSIKDHADTCSGDSGGPLFVPHSSIRGMYQVLGITSYGLADGCGSVEYDIHYPSIYTNVYSYIKWINFHLQI